MHRLCISVILVAKWYNNNNNNLFLPVATPGLEREHPNLFCVYARVGEEKETQILAFWGTNLAAYLSPVGRVARS